MATRDESMQVMERRGEREFMMSRVFDAPRELVWRAYTDPEAIPQWWGPRYLSTVVDEMDVGVGGKWRYRQHDAEGNEYVFYGEYLEVEPPAKLVYTFEYEPMAGHTVVDTAVFEDLGGRTKVTVSSVFGTAEDLEGMMASGMEGGATESWERLAEYLEAQK